MLFLSVEFHGMITIHLNHSTYQNFTSQIFHLRFASRVPADMPLYDILNEFQKGSSHMAAVVKAKGKSKKPPSTVDEEKSEGDAISGGNSQLTSPLLSKHYEKSDNVVVDIEKVQRHATNPHACIETATNGLTPPEDIEDGEVIGIITLEDVFEELLQVIYLVQ